MVIFSLQNMTCQSMRVQLKMEKYDSLSKTRLMISTKIYYNLNIQQGSHQDVFTASYLILIHFNTL